MISRGGAPARLQVGRLIFGASHPRIAFRPPRQHVSNLFPERRRHTLSSQSALGFACGSLRGGQSGRRKNLESRPRVRRPSWASIRSMGFDSRMHPGPSMPLTSMTLRYVGFGMRGAKVWCWTPARCTFTTTFTVHKPSNAGILSQGKNLAITGF